MEDKFSIVFVDDEKMLLHGMKRSLRPWRDKWDMQFIDCAKDALDYVADNPCDLIISDMRMPFIDGATLLDKIRMIKPDATRIILSGYAEEEQVERAKEVAHYFIPKPCEGDELIKIIEEVASTLS